MFGYITPLKSELKVKEFEYFRSYYCGLCNEIKNKFGNIPRFCLNYDLTFIGFLLDGLFSNQIFIKQVRCIKHANKKILILTDTNALDYCANLSILLFDYKLKGDIKKVTVTSIYDLDSDGNPLKDSKREIVVYNK